MECVLEGDSRRVQSVDFSRDEKYVVYGLEDNSARIWNATTGKIEHDLRDHSNWVYFRPMAYALCLVRKLSQSGYGM